MLAEASSLAAHVALDLVRSVRCEVGEAAVLEIAPEELDGIEVRGIGRKPDDTAAGMSCQPPLHERVLVRTAAIPYEDERTAHVAGEMVEKPQHLGTSNVEPRIESQGQRDLPAPRRHDQRPDAGHLLMMARVDRHRRRHAAGRPRAAQDRHHQEARFIETDQVSAEAVQFFLPWPSRAESTRARDDRRVPWPAAEVVAD